MKSLNTALSRIKKVVKKECIHFLFPSFCLHCEEERIEPSKLFCIACEEWLYFFPIKECLETKAATSQKEGIALSLFLHRNGNQQEEVLSTIAALMALQISKLKWPSFDRIIPSPKDPMNVLVAKKLSSYLNTPLWKRFELLSDQTLLTVDMKLCFFEDLSFLEEFAPLKIYSIGFLKEDHSLSFT